MANLDTIIEGPMARIETATAYSEVVRYEAPGNSYIEYEKRLAPMRDVSRRVIRWSSDLPFDSVHAVWQSLADGSTYFNQSDMQRSGIAFTDEWLNPRYETEQDIVDVYNQARARAPLDDVYTPKWWTLEYANGTKVRWLNAKAINSQGPDAEVSIEFTGDGDKVIEEMFIDYTATREIAVRLADSEGEAIAQS